MQAQAPSIQLLRALRSSLKLSSKHRIQPALLQHQLHHQAPCSEQHHAARSFSTSRQRLEPAAPRARNPYAPTHRDRGPRSKEDTQTDFGAMDVLGHIAPPATSVDACTSDGFHLDNGVKTEGGAGILLVGGEAFTWEPWKDPTAEAAQRTISSLLDQRKGILSFSKENLGLLELVHPKPDLLIVGTGGRLWMLSKDIRKYINEVLGCRIDVMDTANATSAYNLLGKERGVEGGAGVGGLFLPIGWSGMQGRR